MKPTYIKNSTWVPLLERKIVNTLEFYVTTESHQERVKNLNWIPAYALYALCDSVIYGYCLVSFYRGFN